MPAPRLRRGQAPAGIHDLSLLRQRKVVDTGLRRHDGGGTEESVIQTLGISVRFWTNRVVIKPKLDYEAALSGKDVSSAPAGTRLTARMTASCTASTVPSALTTTHRSGAVRA